MSHLWNQRRLRGVDTLVTSLREVAVLSMHSSPLTQPGTGDSGGMNVYVRELAGSLARLGVSTTVYVRRDNDELQRVVNVEPGFQVVHIDAGPVDLAKEKLPSVIDEFTEGVGEELVHCPVGLIHANYWLSGVAGHSLKHELDVPLMSTFHTLGQVKTDGGDAEPRQRIDAERQIIGCSDVILANSSEEVRQLEVLYGADPSRIEIVAPGVEHAYFAPGDQRGARKALGWAKNPVLLFVGRIQPLKGLSLAVGALAELGRSDARLVVVGGPSGQEGRREMRRVLELAESLGVSHQVQFVDPQPHYLLSTYYRAADVVLVPSRSESFGLVALEAGACGTPVVAAEVGGLRTLVDHGRTGLLVSERTPEAFAASVSSLLDDPAFALRVGTAAVEHARTYSWAGAASRFMSAATELPNRVLVDCAP